LEKAVDRDLLRVELDRGYIVAPTDALDASELAPRSLFQ